MCSQGQCPIQRLRHPDAHVRQLTHPALYRNNFCIDKYIYEKTKILMKVCLYVVIYRCFINWNSMYSKTNSRLALFMAVLVATQPLLASATSYVYYQSSHGLVVVNSRAGSNPSTGSSGSGGSGGSGGSTGSTGSPGATTPANAPVLSASTNAVVFGGVQVGATATSNLVLANTGNVALSFSAPPAISGDPAFSSSTNCGSTLAAGTVCNVVVSFAPTSSASSTGTLNVASNDAGSPFIASLSGTGITQAVAAASASSLAFGQVNVGSPGSSSVILTNRGNTVMNLLAAPSVTGDGAFSASTTCASTLAVGASCTTTVTYTPTAAATSTGSLSFATDAANGSPVLALSGTGILANASTSPGSLLFPGTTVGATSATQIVTLSNSGSASLTLSAPSVVGQFSLVSSTCGSSLSAGSTCTYTVSFNPTASGVITGSLTIPNSVNTQVVGLFGTGNQTAGALNPDTLDFGLVNVGSSSAPASVAVNNTGDVPLALTSLTVTGPFTATQNCGSLPASLAVTASCSVSVVYTPTLTTTETGTLSIATGAGTKTVALTGMGWSATAGLSTSSLTFTDTKVGGASAVQSVTVSNTGSAPLTLSTASVSGAFTLASTTCSSALAAGSSCQYAVTFQPVAAGAASGSLSIPTSVGTQNVSLGGLGLLTAAGTDAGSLTLASTAVGSTSAAQSVTLNNTGNTVLSVGSLSTTGAFAASSNCPASLAAGSSCVANVTFTPTAMGVATGSLSINTGAGTQNISLSGNGTQSSVSLSASSLSLDSTVVGASSAVRTVTLSNTGNLSVNVSAAQVSGPFSVSSNCGSFVDVTNSCTYSVTFTPTAMGAAEGTLTLPTAAGTKTVSLSATGLQTSGSESVSTLAFGNVNVSSSSTAQSVTLNNTGNTALSLSAISVSGPFSASQSCGTLPVSVAVSGSCAVNVTFNPSAMGTATGTLSLVTAAGTQTVSLSGAGLVAVPALSSSALSFTTTVGGTSATQAVTLSNNGNTSMTVSTASVSGAFGVSSTTCSTTLAAGANCVYNVAFTASTMGAASGLLSVPTGAGTLTASLTGAGMQTSGSTNVGTLSLGDITVGVTSAPGSVVLSNTGNTVMALSSVSVSGPFTATQNCGTLPASVAVGNTCTINVTFTPTTNAAASGTLTLDTGAAGIHTVSLTGQGLASSGSLSVSSIPFGSFNTGTTNTSPVTFTNTGNSPLTFTSAPAVTGSSVFTVSANTCGATLAANANCTVTVAFSPVAAASSSGTLTFASDALNSPSTVALSGTGVGVPVASVSSSTLAFGSAAVSSSSSLAVVFSNTGTGSISFTSAPALASGTSAEYSVTGYSCGASLASGESCTVNVQFLPTSPGAATGTLNFATNLAGSPTPVSLSGTGTQAIGTLTANTSADFGSVLVGNASSRVFTYTNSGNIAATGAQVSVTGSQVTIGSNSCGTSGSPVTVAAGASCQVTVTFTPVTAGAISGYSVAMASSASGSPSSLTLAGSGVQVAPTLGTFLNVSTAYTTAPIPLTAPTSNSLGAWSYSSSNPLVATVTNSGGTGTAAVTGLGVTTITATQAAYTGFLPATVTMTLTVTQATTVLSGFNVSPQLSTAAPFVLTAPVSNNPEAFTYSSSNAAVATISGSTLTIVGAGTSTITASQAATTYYTAASETSVLTVTVVGPSLIGNGASLVGACAAGQVGCATWSATDKSANAVLSGNGLSLSAATNYAGARANIGTSSEKVYWELTYTGAESNVTMGIATSTFNLGNAIGAAATSYGFSHANPNKMTWAGASYNAFTPPAAVTGMVIGLALDMSAKQLHVSVNGVWQYNTSFGVVASGLSGVVYPAIVNTGSGAQPTANFGQGNFSYPVPSGYQAGVW